MHTAHKERGIIFGGLQEIASKTCVKFAVHKDQHYLRGHDFVYITKTKSKGCWSYVGRVGNGKQVGTKNQLSIKLKFTSKTASLLKILVLTALLLFLSREHVFCV